MKQFDINVHYDVLIFTTVYAETEDEAMELASEAASTVSLSEGLCHESGKCVTNTSEMKEVPCRIQWHDNPEKEEDVIICVGCDGVNIPPELDEKYFFYAMTEEIFNKLCEKDNGEDFFVVSH